MIGECFNLNKPKFCILVKKLVNILPHKPEGECYYGKRRKCWWPCFPFLFTHNRSTLIILHFIKTSPTIQLVVLHTWKQEVAGLIPGFCQFSVQGLMIVIAAGFSSLSPMFRQWLCGKAASGLKKILCGVLVKRTSGKHGYVHWLPQGNWNTVENGIKHHAINQYNQYTSLPSPHW